MGSDTVRKLQLEHKHAAGVRKKRAVAVPEPAPEEAAPAGEAGTHSGRGGDAVQRAQPAGSSGGRSDDDYDGGGADDGSDDDDDDDDDDSSEDFGGLATSKEDRCASLRCSQHLCSTRQIGLAHKGSRGSGNGCARFPSSSEKWS